MGCKKQERGVREMYVFDATANRSTCLICNRNFPKSHLGNLTTHLERFHRTTFESLNKTVALAEVPLRKKIKITLEYDPLELNESWSNLCIKEGRAFKLLDSESLNNIVGPIFDGLKIEKLNSYTISDVIRSKAVAMRKELKELCANRMMSLQIDSASRHTRRIICINVQMIIEDTIVIKTLSMKDIHRKHTGININEHVLSTLRRYDIQLGQIYTCTQDNGKNFICAANMLQYEDDDVLEDENESNDDEDQDAFLIELDGVIVIRCAAHTLALAVSDTLSQPIYKIKIKKFRQLMKLLRTPTYIDLLTAQHLPLPKKYNQTRWNTTYDMLLSLMTLKEFCKTQNVSIDEADWSFAEIYLKIFKPVKICTKRLQSEQLYLGDFFKIWLDLTLRVKELSSDNKLAEDLYKNLIIREHLFCDENESLLGALYLDPRFRNIVTKIRPDTFKIEKAQEHLLALYKKVKKIETGHLLSALEQSSSSSSPNESAAVLTSPLSGLHEGSAGQSDLSSASDTVDNENILEKYISNLFDNGANELGELVLDDDIVTTFGILCNYEDKKPLDTNILKYWHRKRFSNPTLHKLAMIVHAVPATQVSVERCFSVLKYVLNDNRGSMNEDTLEDLMLLRLNN